MKINNCILLIGVAAILVGCSRQDDSAQVDEYNTEYSRMTDPAYTNALHQQIKARNDIVRRYAEAERNYRRALAIDSNSVETAECKAKCEAIRRERDDNDRKTKLLVALRMQREANAIEARKEAEAANK